MKENKKNKIKKRRYMKKAEINLDEIPSSSLKMKYFKRKRNQKRIKNAINQTHFLLKILSIIAVLWLTSRLAILPNWYLPQDAFDKYPSKHLRIISNNLTPNEKILKKLKSIPMENKPIYMIDTAPYENAIKELNPIKKAFVRRYWLPARLEITLEEEIPVLTIAANQNAPEVAALTVDGNIITKEYLPINPKYTTYKVLTYDDYSKWTKKEINSLHILAQRLEDYSGEKLLFLDIRNKNDVYAQLETLKIRIGELNTTLNARIERLSSIMPEIEDLKSVTEYLDLRWEDSIYLLHPSRKKETNPNKTQQKQ